MAAAEQFELTAPRTLVLNRQFQLWLYTVSHAQALLVSPGVPRISLLFKGVESIRADTAFTCVELRASPDQRRTNFEFVADCLVAKIVATAGFVAYDDGDHNSPSPFAQSLTFIPGFKRAPG